MSSPADVREALQRILHDHSLKSIGELIAQEPANIQWCILFYAHQRVEQLEASPSQ